MWQNKLMDKGIRRKTKQPLNQTTKKGNRTKYKGSESDLSLCVDMPMVTQSTHMQLMSGCRAQHATAGTVKHCGEDNGVLHDNIF